MGRVPMFTLQELVERLRRRSSTDLKSVAYNQIKNRRRARKIGVIKEGVYYVVRPGTTTTTAPADEYLESSSKQGRNCLGQRRMINGGWVLEERIYSP